jgi:hypothetical protein
MNEAHESKVLDCLRWLAVLPAAIGAFGAMHLVIIVGGTLGAEMEGRSPMPDWVFQIVNSIIPPVCFVWAGMKVAPKYRRIVALVLTAAFCIVAAGLLTYGILTDYPRYPIWWFIVTGVVSIVSATVSCIFFQMKENR